VLVSAGVSRQRSRGQGPETMLGIERVVGGNEAFKRRALILWRRRKDCEGVLIKQDGQHWYVFIARLPISRYLLHLDRLGTITFVQVIWTGGSVRKDRTRCPVVEFIARTAVGEGAGEGRCYCY
jgi:hypothetical protein